MSLTQGDPLPNITTTQSAVTSAPSWYTDYLSGMAAQSGVGTANAQYAGAQPLQNQAFNLAGSTAGQYQPQLGQASNLASNVANSNTAQNIGQYMTPYTNQVVDALGALGRRNINDYLIPQANASAVGTGQFGSKRGAEVLGQAINTGLSNLTGAQAQALQTGYGQALSASNADQAQKLAAAQQLGGLAQTGQNMNLADINALATMGGQQQTIAQNQQLFPLQALNLGSQALRGYSVPTTVSNTYTGPIPGAYAQSPLAQIAGLGSILGGISNTALGQKLMSGIGNSLANSTRIPSSIGGQDTTPGGTAIAEPLPFDSTQTDIFGNPLTGENANFDLWGEG